MNKMGKIFIAGTAFVITALSLTACTPQPQPRPSDLQSYLRNVPILYGPPPHYDERDNSINSEYESEKDIAENEDIPYDIKRN